MILILDIDDIKELLHRVGFDQDSFRPLPKLDFKNSTL